MKSGTKKRTALTLALIAVLLILLAAVLLHAKAEHDRRVAEEQRLAELAAVEELKLNADELDLASLDIYPNLKRLDLSGSRDYSAIMAYAQEHPQVEVLYTVDCGGTVLDNRQEECSLEQGKYDPALIRERLAFLPRLRSLHFQLSSGDGKEMEQLRAAYPDREIDWQVQVMGTLYPSDLTELDLTRLEAEGVDAVAAALPLFPGLKKLILTDEQGGNRLSLEQLSPLQEAADNLELDYRFPLFDRIVSCADESLAFENTPIGEEGLERLRAVIPHMSSLHSLLLDNCGISYDSLAQLRLDFPEIRIDWRVWISDLSFLTDVKVIHLTFLLDHEDANQKAKVLQYCDKVEFLDLGHQHITDVSFLACMPELKNLILSYNDLSDISPISACKKLEMAEFYFCYQLEDLSPLASCESLKLLNVSATAVHDISPIFGLKNLERFYCIMNYGIPEEQMSGLREALPSCWITFKQVDSYAYKNVGWSFDEVGGVRAQWYLDMYKIYRYRSLPYFFGDYPEEFRTEQGS